MLYRHKLWIHSQLEKMFSEVKDNSNILLANKLYYRTRIFPQSSLPRLNVSVITRSFLGTWFAFISLRVFTISLTRIGSLHWAFVSFFNLKSLKAFCPIALQTSEYSGCSLMFLLRIFSFSSMSFVSYIFSLSPAAMQVSTFKSSFKFSASENCSLNKTRNANTKLLSCGCPESALHQRPPWGVDSLSRWAEPSLWCGRSLVATDEGHWDVP